MDDAKGLCTEWQSLLEYFRPVFTLGGWARFAQWATGTVLCSEEHTITQILTGLGLEDQWRTVEHFAEYGAWDREAVERQLMRLVDQEHPARWGRYHPVAIDDTKEHRTSADVWGTCTFHESAARSPNRATTVRAHNWVVMGDLAPGKPWTYLPTASRLYLRKTQLPAGERFRTKTAMAVEMLREVDTESAAPILAAFDGAYAMETVVEPCLNPPPGARRIEFVTRLRKDARLYEFLPKISPITLVALLLTILVMFSLKGGVDCEDPVGRVGDRRAAADLLRGDVSGELLAQPQGRRQLCADGDARFHGSQQQFRVGDRRGSGRVWFEFRRGVRGRHRTGGRGSRFSRPGPCGVALSQARGWAVCQQLAAVTGPTAK